MRFFFLALPIFGISTAASAADLPLRTIPIPAAPPAFTWTGAYGGLFAGYGDIEGKTQPLCVGQNGLSNGLFCPVRSGQKAKADGFIAGSELGYNYQLTPGAGFVVGAAVDHQFTPLRSYATQAGDFPVTGFPGVFPRSIDHVGQRLDGLTTVRGKLGYAFDRLFVYGTGGLAVGSVRIDNTTTLAALPLFDNRKGSLRTGYVAGGGVEYAITPSLSLKGEVLYYDLGSKSVASRDVYDGFSRLTVGSRVETNGILARAGINYRFGQEGAPFVGPAINLAQALINPAPYAQPVPSIWNFEIGARYFYSTGNFRKTLGDPFDPTFTNSRLIYRDFPIHSGESFARLDHNPTGLFAKGLFGSGFVGSGGKLNDEDFAPRTVPYSNTITKIRNGSSAFAVIDGGYDFLVGANYKLGAFVGYQYFSERANGYGCSQIGGNQGICGLRNTYPTSIAVLSQDAQWHAVRVGLAGEVRYDRFKVAVEGAYLPYVSMNAFDRHWLRADINPLREKADGGDGYFLQGVVSYDLTRDISVGVGARYMKMSTQRKDGSAQFPFPGTPPSPEKFSTDRYGAFAQVSYKFSDNGFGFGGR